MNEPNPGAASSRTMIKVAIIDDDPVVQRYFAQVIGTDPRYEVAGIAADLRSGKALIAALPDIVLLDVGLPDGNGYDLVAPIKAQIPAKVLIISTLGDRDTVIAALQAGADGYLLKDSSPAQLLEGMALVLDDGVAVSPKVARYLLDALRADPAPVLEPTSSALADDRLTRRETELLCAFAEGLSYKEAARRLKISPHTVGNHVKAIYRKLDVNSRIEAIRAVQSGGESQ